MKNAQASTGGTWTKPDYVVSLKYYPPRDLEELFSLAEDYARYCLFGCGQVKPTFFFITKSGLPGMLSYTPMFGFHGDFNEEEQVKFRTLGRTMAIALEATTAVFMSEGYALMTGERTGRGKDFKIPEGRIAEHPERREVLFLVGDSRPEKVYKLRVLSITRDGNGKFFDLVADGLAGVDSSKPDMDIPEKYKRRVICREEPPAEAVQFAQAALELLGYKRQDLGSGKPA